MAKAATPAAGDSELRTLPSHLGPYEAWNFGPGKHYAFPALRQEYRYLSAVADHGSDRASTMPTAIASGLKFWTPTLWQPDRLSFTPFVIENPAEREIEPRTLSTQLSGALTTIVASRATRPRFRAAFPVAQSAMHAGLDTAPYEPRWHPDPGLRARIGEKRMTIVAVIDDGIPFAHRAFRDAAGKRTRVEFCWLQSVAREPVEKPSVLFGREYVREQIDQLIERHGGDEDTLYRKSGAASDTEQYGSLISRHGSHGAHVMDLAAGFASDRGEQPPEESRIIAVQLPNTIAWDTSGFGKDMYMLSAFHYIFDRAEVLAREYGISRPRLVVNFSYGFSGGRHDGRSELELAIDEMVALRRRLVGPTAVVVPAGNMFLGRLHAVIAKDRFADNQASLRWRVQPNDRTSSYLELWFGRSFDPEGYFVELVDPRGRKQASLEIAAGERLPAKPEDFLVAVPITCGKPAVVAQLSTDKHRGERWRVMVALAPTEPDNSELPGADAGVWTLVLRRRGRFKQLAEDVHCWIQRDADPELLQSGSRQSYIEDPDDVGYAADGSPVADDTADARIRRFGGLNGLATGRNVLVVAGFERRISHAWDLADVGPAHYSSAGSRSADTWPARQVDCSSMSDRSDVLPGTIAAGVRSGSLSFLQGTSAAAPLVARQLAGVFATAGDTQVDQAASDNYLSLIPGWTPPAESGPVTATVRMGRKRVRPHPPSWIPEADSMATAAPAG
jgi:hypothetical protein